MILALHDGKEEHATDFHCTQGATVQVQVLDARVRPEQLRNGPRPIVADGVACRRKGAGEKHTHATVFIDHVAFGDDLDAGHEMRPQRGGACFPPSSAFNFRSKKKQL